LRSAPGCDLAFWSGEAQIILMATNIETVSAKPAKLGVLGRSAATGRYVMAPVVLKKRKVSDKQITAAVLSVLAKKK
jgi:hypothetical protein